MNNISTEYEHIVEKNNFVSVVSIYHFNFAIFSVSVISN